MEWLGCQQSLGPWVQVSHRQCVYAAFACFQELSVSVRASWADHRLLCRQSEICSGLTGHSVSVWFFASRAKQKVQFKRLTYALYFKQPAQQLPLSVCMYHLMCLVLSRHNFNSFNIPVVIVWHVHAPGVRPSVNALCVFTFNLYNFNKCVPWLSHCPRPTAEETWSEKLSNLPKDP